MNAVLLSVHVRRDEDLVVVRERTRQVAQLSGLLPHDQITFTASVSEVARNALRHAGGGAIEFGTAVVDGRPMLIAAVRDSGAAAARLCEALDGRTTAGRDAVESLLSAKRISDRFDVQASAAGGTVLVGKRLPACSAPPTHEWRARIAAELARTAPAGPVEELQRQNGELVTALDTLSRRTAEVERLNAELAETNRGVLALYAELDDKAESLRSASAAKSRFVSDVSHELRTPLNAIVSLSGILLDRVDGELTAEQETQVSLIQRSALSLVEMVSGMLDLAKIEAGKVELRLAPVEVADLLAAVRGMFRLMLPPGVTLQVDEPARLAPLTTDEGKLAQILRNLVANALKFTQAGVVQVSADADDDVVRFVVRDTGIGLAPEDFERVFHDFTQIDAPVQRTLRGTGLGLPLARKLARLLGGDVTVISTLGAGSTFTLAVPWAGPPARAVDAASGPRRPDGGG